MKGLLAVFRIRVLLSGSGSEFFRVRIRIGKKIRIGSEISGSESIKKRPKSEGLSKKICLITQHFRILFWSGFSKN